MRRKFFLIVFAFLLASIAVVSVLQLLFFETERLRLVDQRLESIASSLIASGLSLTMIQNLESTDDLITDLLGEERVDHIINVYSLAGKVLAQNYTATQIPLTFGSDEVHQTYHVNQLLVRVLNIKKGRLVVQVGVVLGPSILNRFSVANARFVAFTGLVFALLLAAAFLGSAVLFRPLRRLTIELRAMSATLESKLGQPLTGFVIGPELAKLSRGSAAKDDFELLCAEIENFVRTLGAYTSAFNAQGAILTHELKTPLTILNNYLEQVNRADNLGLARELSAQARSEIVRLTALINDFLGWSVLSINPARPAEIYAVKVAPLVLAIAADLNRVHSDRVRCEITEVESVFALPDHVRQLVTNLVANALNYSPVDRPVTIRLKDLVLEVVDEGPGIPTEVREHLGQPFNRGGKPSGGHHSSGLGLAWVYALCEKYGWEFKILSNDPGTTVRVTLHAEEA